MASFIGTNKEFRRYIGPMLRNLVQQITRKYRSTISACQHCGGEMQLQSAHVHGRNRNEIIDHILAKFTYNNVVTVDLIIFEKHFKDEHIPLEKTILILCRKCHMKYDSNDNITSQEQETKDVDNQSRSVEGNTYEILPIALEPNDPDVFKRELLVSKRAEIEISYTDGSVERKMWIADRFRMSSSVMGNLRSRPAFRQSNWRINGIKTVHVKIIKKI